jgi:hypothetical protein
MRHDLHRPARRASTAAIYGTVLVMAVVASISEDEAADALEIDEAVLLSSAAVFAAHVYAGLLTERLSTKDEPWRTELWASIVEAWPLMWAAAAPVTALLVAAVAGLGRTTSVTLALCAGLLQLFAWGVAAGRTHGQRVPSAVGSGLITGAIGLFVVLVKAVVH